MGTKSRDLWPAKLNLEADGSAEGGGVKEKAFARTILVFKPQRKSYDIVIANAPAIGGR